MHYTVTFRHVHSGRKLYSGQFSGESPEDAIARCRRFAGCAEGNWSTVTAKPYKPRRKTLGVTIQERDKRDSAIDRGPCVPLALAACTGLPYADTNAALELVNARSGSKRDGTKTSRLPQACNLLGFEAIDLKSWQHNRRFTLRKLAACAEYTKGKFVVCSRDHALALIDGKYTDCADTSDIVRVREVWRIEPKENRTKLLTAPGAGATL